MAGVRQVVDPPSFTPTPYGLLTTVEWPPTQDDHWTAGITYAPTCDKNGVNGQLGATTYDANCIAVTGTGGAPPPAAPLGNTASVVQRGATSFESYAEFDCAPVGNAAAAEKAQVALSMSEPWQIERAFWTGLAGGQTVVFPHLAANAQYIDQNNASITMQTSAQPVTGVSGDLLNPAMGLGLLEGALANCYNGVGVIHIPEFALPSFDAWGLIKANGPVMRTLNGNKVAVGAGYPGTAPDGSVRGSNTSWIYATGNVFGFRSDVRVRAPQGPEAFDRLTNTMKMIAERTVVLGWDCCHFAAQIVLGVPKGT